MANQIGKLGALVGLTGIVGTLVWDFGFAGNHDTILGVTAFAVAIITFFGMLILGESVGGRWLPSKGGMRAAIAVTIIVTYLFLVTINTFVVPPSEMAPITKTLVDSLTGIVGVTIAFYFGAEVAMQFLNRDTSAENSVTPDNK